MAENLNDRIDAPRRDAGQLIAEYQPQLRNFIHKRVSNYEDAEDILQDVMYQLVKTINSAMSPIEQVSAWLYRVARNMIINRGAKMREAKLPAYQDDEGNDLLSEEFSEVLFGDDSPATPETEYLRSLVWEELEKALAELPPEQREIFELTEMDGIPVKEIAETAGVPVNTLLSRKHYAVKHLRKRMLGLYDEIVGG
ncbi:MAG: sigma-70 family RNA polymerase sigma factor [Dysgonamonadaceae bacterium]|jgi:RNA polymerase sigma factor (sigma-70 family)|nr:sigma-70 family RNA polymerase sigma factor [Dysgonamonadaceae bacterium]